MDRGFITPVSLHYVRNHGAVPHIAWEVHRCGRAAVLWHVICGAEWWPHASATGRLICSAAEDRALHGSLNSTTHLPTPAGRHLPAAG